MATNLDFWLMAVGIMVCYWLIGYLWGRVVKLSASLKDVIDYVVQISELNRQAFLNLTQGLARVERKLERVGEVKDSDFEEVQP